MVPTKVRTPVEFWNSSKASECAALAVEAVVRFVRTEAAPPLPRVVLAPSLSPLVELDEAMRWIEVDLTFLGKVTGEPARSEVA
jgi:hypothetical protein